ncbi:MAG TPA: hypothetical protein VGQ13_06005, partial [Nitrososphaera sp.]|nr:hypothetical protein [Nitrososphaera sp.]
WNGVHYGYYKDRSYLYTKKYWGPRFLIKYGIPWLTITYIDLKRIIDDYHTFVFPAPDGLTFV